MRSLHEGCAERYIHSVNYALDMGTAILEQGVPREFVVHSCVYSGLLELKLIEFVRVLDGQKPTFLGKDVVVDDRGTVFPATWEQIFEEKVG